MLLPTILAALAVALTTLLLVMALGESRRRSAGRPRLHRDPLDDRPGLATEQIFFEAAPSH